MQIRTLRPDEAGLHRDVRLRALRDAPDSFGGTIDVEESHPMAYWENQTRAVTEPGRNVMFVACDGADIHGMIYGLRDRERSDGARLGGMWVDPAVRRQGLGRQLMGAVFDWAREQDLKAIGLWAPAQVPAALAFYGRMGFHETGGRGPLRAGSDLGIIELSRDV
ncbi:MAG: N-acetyltransferase family protein [Alphaproteobacteria bacterium]